jgi:hypothetical protein
MDAYLWFHEYRLIFLLLALGGWLLFVATKHATKPEICQFHRRNDPLFRRVLDKHGIGEVEILRDSTVLRSKVQPRTPFTVHLILRSQPDRWWVYIHVENSDPVLRPISQERALAAIG